MSFKTKEGEALFNQEYANNLKLWMVKNRSFFVSTSYGQTHIITAGAECNPPLIMLHGAGMGSTIWYRNIDILSEDHCVYAIDVMGDMNKSDPVRSFQNGEDIARWVCEVLDALHIEKTDVIGHSAGGYVALNFAIYAQEKLRRMVLIAPAASFVSFHKQFFIRLALINFIRNKSFIRRVFCNWFVAKGNQIEDFNFDQFIYGIFHYQWKVKPVIPTVIPEDRLRTICIPTILLMGEQEVIYNPNKALARAEKLIPHIETRLIPKASHCLFIEQSDLVNEYMVDFLSC